MHALTAYLLVIGLLNFNLSCCCADSWLLASGAHEHDSAGSHDPGTPHSGHSEQTHACHKAGGSRFITHNPVQLNVVYQTTFLPIAEPLIAFAAIDTTFRKSTHYWNPRDWYSRPSLSMRLLI